MIAEVNLINFIAEASEVSGKTCILCFIPDFNWNSIIKVVRKHFNFPTVLNVL